MDLFGWKSALKKQAEQDAVRYAPVQAIRTTSGDGSTKVKFSWSSSEPKGNLAKKTDLAFGLLKNGKKNSSTPNSDKNQTTTQAVASTPGSISRKFQGTISHLGNPVKGDPMYITPLTKKSGVIKTDTSGLKAEKPMAAEPTKKQMRKAKRVERLENRMATQRKKGVEATSEGRFIDAKNKNNRISNLQKRIDRNKSK